MTTYIVLKHNDDNSKCWTAPQIETDAGNYELIFRSEPTWLPTHLKAVAIDDIDNFDNDNDDNGTW